MAILPLRTIGDPVLRTETKPVDEITDKTKELIKNMKDTMHDASGVGLAAPQVGVSKQIITVDIRDNQLTLINPQVVERSESSEIDEEGCLSIPDENGKVARATRVVVEALDSEGQEVEIEAEGLLARVLQHEIDHLEGVLFVDKLE